MRKKLGILAFLVLSCVPVFAAPVTGVTWNQGTTLTYTVNTPIIPDSGKITGGGLSSSGCFSNPTLPSGLTLTVTSTIANGTCVLSGTPTAPSQSAQYTLFLAPATGGSSATWRSTLAITVAPTNLKYPANSLNFTVGVAVSGITPTLIGIATNYTIAPQLPNGLLLDGSTGRISGTPTAVSPATPFTVTSSDGINTATTRLTLQVSPPVNYSSWSHYRKINLNTSGISGGANIASALYNFPLLIRLTSSDLNFSQVSADGSDIRFTESNDSADLSYEIERWDSTGQAAEIWVRLNKVSPGDSSQFIRMYWGKTGAFTAGSGAVVFDTSNGFQGVWHMNGSSASSDEKDATLNGNTATQVGFPSAGTLGGIGFSRSLFTGSGGGAAASQYFTIANSSSGKLNMPQGGSYTLSAWVNVSNIAGRAVIGKGGSAYCLRINNNSHTEGVEFENLVGWRTVSASGVPVTGNWSHWVFVHDVNAESLWVDGVLMSGTPGLTSANGVLRDQGYDLTLGANDTLTSGAVHNYRMGWNGSLDEIEISSTNRSGDWIKLSYATQVNGQTAVTLGPQQLTSTVPNAPTGVTGVPGGNQVSVSWMPPAFDGGVPITSYTSTAVQDSSRHCTTSASLTCTVTGLVNGTPYTFTVVATNARGSGVASLPSQPVTPGTAPDAPTGVTDSAGNGQVTLTWQAPAFNGGAAITGYRATSVQDTAKYCSTTGSLKCVVTGLTNGTAYAFIVVAINAFGVGAPSALSPPATPQAVSGVPSPPSGVTAVAGNGQATVSWLAPQSSGDSAIKSYTVTSNPDGKTCSTTGILTCTVTGLSNGISYTFNVIARSGVGSSTASTPSTPVTPAGPPDPPTGVKGQSGNSQITVSWNPPVFNGGSIVTGYTVTTVQDSGKHCVATTAAISCTISGLKNGNGYTFTVIATNGAGNSVASIPSIVAVAPMTIPGAPTITAVVGASGQITVSWSAPADTGGASITGYRVVAVQDTNKRCLTSGALTCTVTGLNNATPYSFTVVAINAAGAGVASAASSPVTGIFSFRKDLKLHITASSILFDVPDAGGVVVVSVRDLWGRRIWNESVGAGHQSLSWGTGSASGIPQGVYLLRLSSTGPRHVPRLLAETKILLMR